MDIEVGEEVRRRAKKEMMGRRNKGRPMTLVRLFQAMVGYVVTVELRNASSIRGVIVSVDNQFK